MSISVEQALEVLGKDAKEWWKYRNAAMLKRLIDPVTGQWASQFKANGQKYYIRSAAEGLGMLRYRKLRQMLSIVGFNATYSEQMGALNRMVEAANTLVTPKPRLDQLFHEIANMQEAIRKEDRTWDYSFYAATLFIVRPDEDLHTWTEAEADEKIKDWAAEGLYEGDFFLLVMYWASQLNEWWNILPQKAATLAKDVSAEAG